MKFEIGTRPELVLTRNVSKVDSNLSFLGRRTRISISSSDVSTVMSPSFKPRVTSWTIAPTCATSALYRPAFSTSTSTCQSIPGRGLVSSILTGPSIVS